MSTRTVTYTTSSSSTGFPSKVILLLAGLFAILWSLIDVNFHGHFSCETQRKMVMRYVNTHISLAPYMQEQKDFAGQPEAGTVVCTCTAGRKIRLVGKVVSDDIKNEIGDLAIYAI